MSISRESEYSKNIPGQHIAKSILRIKFGLKHLHLNTIFHYITTPRKNLHLSRCYRKSRYLPVRVLWYLSRSIFREYLNSPINSIYDRAKESGQWIFPPTHILRRSYNKVDHTATFISRNSKLTQKQKIEIRYEAKRSTVKAIGCNIYIFCTA